jgi:hypothetical protein
VAASKPQALGMVAINKFTPEIVEISLDNSNEESKIVLLEFGQVLVCID